MYPEWKKAGMLSKFDLRIHKAYHHEILPRTIEVTEKHSITADDEENAFGNKS